jgi:RHS repeat-associated protein
VGSEQTTFDYWPTGLLKKATLPDGSFLEYTYDAAHRLTQIEDSEGNRIVYTLDNMGNRTAEQLYDPSSALTQTRTRVFNTLNQLWKEIGAAGTASVTTQFAYDNNGNQTGINAPLSRNTVQAYDELNRLKQVTDPLSGITQYGYNALDQLISVTDPRNKVTSYSYNALGDLTQQVSPDTGTTTNTYDSGGNLATSTDARSKTGTYAYDALNRVTSLTYPDQTTSYTYDSGTNQKGRLTQVSDASGSTSWTYDTHGRVLSRQQSMGITKTLGYAYDSDGQLQTLTLPSGNTVAYGYTDGKVTSLTLNGSTTILSNVLYQPFGPTRGWTWGNSTLAIREYDTDGKITDIDSAGLKTYSYDDAFRISGITDASNSSLSQSYGYDLLDRLTSATGSSLNQGWTYDANGNRLTQTGSDASTYTVSTTNNRLSSVSGALSRTYSYDNAGNTTADGAATFTYNDTGRMVSATKAGATTTYALNALGQRVKKTTSGSSTYFVYDEVGHLVGEYDSSGTLIQETVWFGDAPVATPRPNGGGVNLFYVHTDHLNTPRRTSRPSDDVVVWRWDSDPFGTTTADEDPDGDSNLFVYGLRFPGQYFDTETGLHYNYMRTYDPQAARYAESDPLGLGGGTNTYAYTRNSPLLRVDPTGEYDCTYSISNHSMTCVPRDQGHPQFASTDFVSGNNQDQACPDCQNNPNRIDRQNHGPLPTGQYSMGAQRRNSSRRPLTPNAQTDMHDRDSMQTHGCTDPATCSEGCIAATTNATRDELNRILSLEEGRNTLTVVP